MIRSFRDLEVYKRSKDLFGKIVETTKGYPREGRYLSDQTIRAANSIHANVAEGFGRSIADFCNYLTRSLGSNNEVLSHLEDAHIAKYISKERYDQLQGEYTILGKQLYRLKERWQRH